MDQAIKGRNLTESPLGGEKPVWKAPEVIFLGELTDLIQGRGKVGSNFDSDPRNTRKQGTG